MLGNVASLRGVDMVLMRLGLEVQSKLKRRYKEIGAGVGFAPERQFISYFFITIVFELPTKQIGSEKKGRI